MSNRQTTAVVYIARKMNAGLASYTRFLESLDKNSAGMSFDLFIIAKGWDIESLEFHQLQEMAHARRAEVFIMPDDGFDWGAYFRVVKSVQNKYLCLFNSHSVIKSENWLASLVKGLETAGVGAAGATGSYGSWRFTLPYLNKDVKSFFLYPLRVLKTFAVSVRYFSDSLPFPSPHLRSNSFITTRENFLEFSEMRNIPKTKKDAHSLESGVHSYTAFLNKKGLKVVVVGKNSKIYFPEEWETSQTFRVPEQNNLLVSDNQTNNYLVADSALKRRLEWAAWGKAFS